MVKGFDTILVVVNRLTKYAHFVLLAHPFTTQDIVALYIKEVVRFHGFLSSIVSNRDKIFMSSFWSELFKQAGTTLKMSFAYHPQSDGQTEAVNKCLKTYLICLTGSKPKQWWTWLSWVEFWYNTNNHSSICITRFKALYGRESPPLLRGRLESVVEDVWLMMAERNQVVDKLKFQLNRAQNIMRQYVDKKRRDVVFKVGEFVYLKLYPYRM